MRELCHLCDEPRTVVFSGALVVAVVLVLGCGTSERPLQDTLSGGSLPGRMIVAADSGRTTDTIDASPGEEIDAGAGDVAAGTVQTNCGPSGSIIYLLSEDGTLRTFDPSLVGTQSAFHTVGTLHCVLSDGTPWKPAGDMAMDQEGLLWITDRPGHLFRANPNDATCTATPFQAGQNGFTNMAMSFVGTSGGGARLMVVDNGPGPASTGGRGLAAIDLASWLLTPIGNFDAPLTGWPAELAGTNDGRLYGYFPGELSWVAEIDPASGHLLWTEQAAPASITGQGQTHIATAASLWGGALLLYLTNTLAGPSANIYQFDLAARTTSTLLSQIGFTVTGAVVRTCTSPLAVGQDL